MMQQDIARLRLRNQHLAGEPWATPAEGVRSLCAVQSQDYGGAKWGVAQRTAGATDADLDRLFDAGTILRTHVMRPTWHFVLPEDIRWLLALTAPRVRATMASTDRKLGLDDAVLTRSYALLTDTLRNGAYRTRPELARVLDEGGVAASGQRLAHLLMRAELDALICSGPRRGKQFTYALLDERAPATGEVDHDESLSMLTLRYFGSHGPATLHDFAWWSGLSVSDARRGVEMNAAHLAHEKVDGSAYWFVPPATVPELSAPVVHLLPNYDEMLVAYKGYIALFDAFRLGHTQPDAHFNALMSHIIILDGQVIGRWRRTIEKGAVRFDPTLLVPLDEAERAALHAAAEAYGQFLGMPVSVA